MTTDPKKISAVHRLASRWAARTAIALTALACVLAISYRAPLRARYWAWRLTSADAIDESRQYLAALCNSADHAYWAASSLLAHPDVEIRKCGALVLQGTDAPWAQRLRLEHLADPDPEVRALAAAGFAIHPDNRMLPRLTEHYRSRDTQAAIAACLAAAYLANPEAVNTLDEWSRLDTEPQRRAALIDALALIGAPAAVPPLLRLLDDPRPCNTPSLSRQLATGLLDQLKRQGTLPPDMHLVTSQPTPRTIAERAAAALSRITGIAAPFTDDPDQRRSARLAWETWYAEQSPRPQASPHAPGP
jgi:hypothetical protein